MHSGNATNSLNNSSGDFIYTTNQTVSEVLTTNLKNSYHDHLVNIFPNPVCDLINIALPTYLEEKYTTFQLFDINGVFVARCS